jgi:anaerobic selenocysteine-containing dehydrogenase
MASGLAGAALMGSSHAHSTFASSYPEPAGFAQGDTVTTCNYCGIQVQSVEGKIMKIDGNPLDPKSHGVLCARDRRSYYRGVRYESS